MKAIRGTRAGRFRSALLAGGACAGLWAAGGGLTAGTGGALAAIAAGSSAAAAGGPVGALDGISLVAVAAGALSGCASEPLPPEDPAARKDLDAFFLRFRQKVQEGQADSLPLYLSRESLNWIDDIRRASRTEPVAYLQDRPFFEVLAILALRVERRLNPAFDDRPASLLEKLVVENGPVRKSLIKSELGESAVRGSVGTIGLREAPNVPVFHFIKEDGRWKFHLVQSLPLILQGAESLARQRKSTHVDQAIYVLEQFGGRRVLPEDLNR